MRTKTSIASFDEGSWDKRRRLQTNRFFLSKSWACLKVCWNPASASTPCRKVWSRPAATVAEHRPRQKAESSDEFPRRTIRNNLPDCGVGKLTHSVFSLHRVLWSHSAKRLLRLSLTHRHFSALVHLQIQLGCLLPYQPCLHNDKLSNISCSKRDMMPHESLCSVKMTKLKLHPLPNMCN